MDSQIPPENNLYDWWASEEGQAVLQYLDQMDQLMGAGPAPNEGTPLCGWTTAGIICGQGFTTFNALMDHLGKVHGLRGSAAQRLQCQWSSQSGYCGQMYRRDGFRRHIGTHVGSSVPCPECGKSFSRRDSMLAHLKSKHGA